MSAPSADGLTDEWPGLRVRLRHAAAAALVVELAGELDGVTVVELHDKLRPQWILGLEVVVLDVARLSFISVEGLDAVRYLRRRASRARCAVYLVGEPLCLVRLLAAAEPPDGPPEGTGDVPARRSCLDEVPHLAAGAGRS
ncbi:STAS domain-containing protein [Bounagaea algeriensis]